MYELQACMHLAKLQASLFSLSDVFEKDEPISQRWIAAASLASMLTSNVKVTMNS